MADVTDPADLRRILETTRTVAVLGAHPDERRPAGFVARYLVDNGYVVRPVNPARAGEQLAGETILAALADVPEPIDLVDVFRRSEALPAHLPELLALRPRPKVVWFQSGIRNDEVAEALAAVGIAVVQDRCLKVEHRLLVGGR